MENIELNLDEMAEVVGGKGGYSSRPDPMPGRGIYRIQRGDTLIGIAQMYHTTWQRLKEMNRSVIRDENDITAGYYIYVPFER